MELKHGIDESYITLGKYETFKIKVSGGISWYPKDATTVKNLQLYSDYAMYKVKHTCKGIFANFNKTDYDNDSYMSRNRAELLKLIETESLHYYFQPIVSTKDGSVFAYEALMRSFMPNLKNPEEILNIAKMESKLGKIEELTMFKAMEGYQENIKNHYFDENTKIFVNSIASEMLSPEMIAKFEKTFEPYLHNVVIEVTEGEKMNETLHQQKQKFVEKWHGALALDDYGSGYNSEILLLSITPKYIKIDMSFIHNIDKDNDKQKIVENIVSYGHDIEASWLIHEAALVLGDKTLLEKVEPLVEYIAAAADEGLTSEGSMIYETFPDKGITDRDCHWWVQAENVVGHINLYQHFDDEVALQKAFRCWEYIKKHLIDYQNGEWYWSVRADGTVNTADDKAGFWKCPYHNGRMCMEMLERFS